MRQILLSYEGFFTPSRSHTMYYAPYSPPYLVLSYSPLCLPLLIHSLSCLFFYFGFFSYSPSPPHVLLLVCRLYSSAPFFVFCYLACVLLQKMIFPIKLSRIVILCPRKIQQQQQQRQNALNRFVFVVSCAAVCCTRRHYKIFMKDIQIYTMNIRKK